MAPAANRSYPLLLWLALFVVALGFGGYLAWLWLKKPPQPDMVAVLQVNTRGVGAMEHFNYAQAAEEFDAVVRMAPNWVPGQINLGIALLNKQDKGSLLRAIDVLERVLQEQPDNPYAHHCLGIILKHQDKYEAALDHFQAVTRIAPDDPHAWFFLGECHRALGQDDQATSCFRRANQLDPHLIGAIYSLAMAIRAEDIGKANEYLNTHKALSEGVWESLSGTKYTEMGRYAEVIGRAETRASTPRTGPLPLFARSDKLQIRLKPGTRWASASDFGTGDSAELRRQLRARFGATMVVLDCNGDGRPDVFLLGAVVEAGRVHDLLLRNDGDCQFTDVTDEAGLSQAGPSVGCCVADFDNDGHPDLLITGVGEQRLYRNSGKGTFEDVTVQAGLDKLKTVCLGATFVDLDQDGDLDLVVAQFAANPADALALLRDAPPNRGKGLAVFLNVGEARAVNPNVDPPPLPPRFRAVETPGALLGDAVPTVGLAAADVDLDHDIDLFVLADRTPAAFVLNDRLLRFHRAVVPANLVPPGQWNGCLVLDVDHDQRSDLLLVGRGLRPVLLMRQAGSVQKDVAAWFQSGSMDAPPLLQARAIDLDYDGWTDVVGLSDERRPVLLHNDGGHLVHRREALGADADWPNDLISLAVADFDGDTFLDVLVWSEGSGLQLRANQGNGNAALHLQLTGHRKATGNNLIRCNADGFGVWAAAQTSDFWTAAENTTLSAGLGQSRQPLVLGLGARNQADVVRLRWPDNCVQAEFNIQAGQTVRIDENNRKPGSCPVLFSWDGQRFTFVTDFLGAGAMGEGQPDGTTRPPRPEEAVKIESHQLATQDGQYTLKVAQPMNEIVYLDRLQLVTVDHPADVRVYPDERFGFTSPLEKQELFAFRREIYPGQARDHRGLDVTRTLRHWDRATVDAFARRTWLGFAEDHWIELDFGNRLAEFGPTDRLVLCLAGWTDYAYPESIWAANQAGVDMLSPNLERLDENGHWQSIIADMGLPAGLPRMMTLDVTSKLGGPRCVLRVRTNLCVYWDQVFVAPVLDHGSFQVTAAEVAAATLATRGCAQEFSPDGKLPTIYDHDRLEPVPIELPSGFLTRLGEVTELLGAADDRFVVFGPGDEVTVKFDARKLPALKTGLKRSFVLRTWGYSKDSAPFTAHGATVGPLPFRAMSNYPYGPTEHHPDLDYQRRYNTRRVGK